MSVVSGSPKAHPRAKLLVVDDEAGVRAGLRTVLSLLGYHVDEAASGYEALELLKNMSYDLMLLDVQMPGMDGSEVMERARKICPDLSVIVLTGHASLESAITAVKSDVVDYMHKPPDVEDLAATISRALQERDERLRQHQLLNLISGALDTLDQETRPFDSAQDRPTDSPSSPASPLSLSPSSSPPAPAERFLYAGPLTLDRQKRLVVVQDEPVRTVELTEGEAAILTALMTCPNQVLSWSNLVHAAMGYILDKQEAQNQARLYVLRLRRKIETDPGKPRLIRTVRGRGYFLSLD